jgi:hypothetical protein
MPHISETDPNAQFVVEFAQDGHEALLVDEAFLRGEDQGAGCGRWLDPGRGRQAGGLGRSPALRRKCSAGFSRRGGAAG